MSGVEFVAETPQAQAAPDPAPVPSEELPAAVRPQRLGRRSLTSRLVVGVVSLVAILVMIIGACTYLALRSFLSNRLDDQLESTASGSLDVLFGTSTLPDPGVKAPTGVWAVALDTSGHVITYPRAPSVNWMRLTYANRLELATADENSVVTIQTRDHEQLRVITKSVLAYSPAKGEEDAIAVIGLSTDDEKTTLRRLVATELVIGASAVALALLMTYVGVRFSLRGLRRVTTTAQEVAAELGPSGVALQRRVPVTEEGTEIAQLTDSMNTLLQATETQFAARVESEERMRQFLADASHELRTPLTSIRGYAELARMQRAAGEREVEDNLGRIEAEGTRMSRLVEDLLLLARGDGAGSPAQRVPVDVGELVNEAVNGARAAFPERTITVDAMVPISVHGDPDQLLRVVRNLITNAVVHTRPGPAIRVRGFADGPWMAIQVVDGGPGLPPEEASHVFERFWRADKARTRARGGSGLGLSIVASIVQAHGGAVRFDSSVEAGSTVTIWLPAAP